MLRAQDLGLAIPLVPIVQVVMNVADAASAYPAGRVSDRIGRRLVLAGGALVLIAADIVIALATIPLGVFVGVALWGLHMGLTQGLFAALVADSAPARLHGTAFGLFNLAGGVRRVAVGHVRGRSELLRRRRVLRGGPARDGSAPHSAQLAENSR